MISVTVNTKSLLFKSSTKLKVLRDPCHLLIVGTKWISWKGKGTYFTIRQVQQWKYYLYYVLIQSFSVTIFQFCLCAILHVFCLPVGRYAYTVRQNTSTHYITEFILWYRGWRRKEYVCEIWNRNIDKSKKCLTVGHGMLCGLYV